MSVKLYDTDHVNLTYQNFLSNCDISSYFNYSNTSINSCSTQVKSRWNINQMESIGIDILCFSMKYVRVGIILKHRRRFPLPLFPFFQ